jgi:hypothetical protein
MLTCVSALTTTMPGKQSFVRSTTRRQKRRRKRTLVDLLPSALHAHRTDSSTRCLNRRFRLDHRRRGKRKEGRSVGRFGRKKGWFRRSGQLARVAFYPRRQGTDGRLRRNEAFDRRRRRTAHRWKERRFRRKDEKTAGERGELGSRCRESA